MIGSRHHVLIALTLALTMGLTASDGIAETQRVQTRFVSMENIQGFSGFFNVTQGTVRIVALLSPTSPECTNSLAGVQKILTDIPSKRLRVYVVFVPVLDDDSERTALMRSADVIDRRISYFWDPGSAVAEAFKPVMDPEAGSMVYLLFDTDAVLRDPPTAPKRWMSPADTGDARAFDVDALEAAVLERLDAFEKRESGASSDGQ